MVKQLFVFVISAAELRKQHRFTFRQAQDLNVIDLVIIEWSKLTEEKILL